VTKVKDKNALEYVVKADGGDWGTGPLGSWMGLKNSKIPCNLPGI
jgi:hypothetical protein